MTLGDKYVRTVHDIKEPKNTCKVDVYEVLEAFQVTCPARQHAIKKLLCAGLRNKGSVMQDLNEAKFSIVRALEMQYDRERGLPCSKE